MELSKLPPISSLPSLTSSERAAVLDLLFEPCVQLHTLSVALLQERAFPSYDDMIASIGVQLTDLAESTSTSDKEWVESILAAHPRLGDKKVDSSQSRAEQAQLNIGGDDESKSLARLNEEYETTFPGLRYVVFVNGRSRAAVMKDMTARISRGDINRERFEAIKAMCEIAADRANKAHSKA
ncbi:hypothetical protein MMC17_003118 [Xylographa soralifera]|nr:hypothetical protein [Xylographa soralifera]